MRSTLTALIASLCLSSGAQGLAQFSELYAVGDEVTWVFEQNGERIGAHLLRYDGPSTQFGSAAHHFSGWVRIDAVPALPMEQRYQAELWVDDGGWPLHHVLRAQLGSDFARIEVTFAGQRAAVEIEKSGRSQELTVDVPTGVLLQTNNFIGWFELMLLSRLPEPGESTELQLLSSNSVQTLSYQISHKSGPDGSDGLDAPAVYEDSLGEVLTIAADGRVLELAVPSQGLVIRRAEEPFETFELEPPASRIDERFVYEEVTIEHGEARLAGMVTKLHDRSQPLPAVFFVSGSGLQDRDGFGSGIEIGTRTILDHLTAAGFLVLRVDDRGVGASTGPMEGLGFDELVADARACVDFLFEREDVDPERLAVIGHSEGGVTVPLLALERPRIAAVVLMAATGRPLADVIMDQNRAALETSGLEGEALEGTLAGVRDLLDRLAGDGEVKPEELPADQRAMLANRAWFQDHARQDPPATLAQVKCPVLILQGAKDFQVSAEKDARALAAALEQAEHPDYDLHVFPELDHLFKRVQGEQSTLAEYFTERPVDEQFLSVLDDWLRARLVP